MAFRLCQVVLSGASTNQARRRGGAMQMCVSRAHDRDVVVRAFLRTAETRLQI